LNDPPCPVVLTCRSAAEGGLGCRGDTERAELLTRAATMAGQWVDFELASLDSAGPLLDVLAPAGEPSEADTRPRLILSAHDFLGRPANLPQLLAEMTASPCHVCKVVFTAAAPEDALAALELLPGAGKPTFALAMGECGLASRILAGKFGAFGTFAALAAGAESAPGQPTVDELRNIYRWDRITPATKVFGVVGCPVGHSMSPAIHNAAFTADGVDAVYVPFRVEPGPENFNRFIDAVLQRPWFDLAGLSVTIPHKENALARVGAQNVDELARAIGAINTIEFTGLSASPMRGWNTDYRAAIDALTDGMNCTAEDLAGANVAVLGAGGAARAIVAALTHYGANTTIYNRTIERAGQLARDFDTAPTGSVKAKGLDGLHNLRADVIINCTPLGMHPNTDACPIPAGVTISAKSVVFDTIYNPVETRLLHLAAAAGARTVSGVEMFVNQAVRQYEIWLGRPAPRHIMRKVVLECLSKS
ncbi:MAG: shikimate dehydrogenase, partial [Planctomycetes bacterium]|nr:shikimate dehydrogenase [Planctomycetota bacterium]